MGKIEDPIFINEFLWDDAEFDADLFFAIQGGDQVEVSKIGSCKPGIWAQADTIEEQFDKFEGAHFNAAVTVLLPLVICVRRFLAFVGCSSQTIRG